jgi:lactoylglutathione lyase/glyoxylase I family protein
MPSLKEESRSTDRPFASARVVHAALRVPDIEASKRWFVEKLDFRVEREWPVGDLRYAWLSPAGDNSLHVEIVGGNSPEPNPDFGTLDETLEYGGYHHVCIDVADLDRALEELGRRGVVTIGEPIAVTAIGRRVAFVADPWGNLVELAEVSAGEGAARQIKRDGTLP